ncbi:MAG: HU family DNA-binding protein [Planctomycetes bacterium]|nr:HU family DNA-binding protein [Planctomycetota bacterium]
MNKQQLIQTVFEYGFESKAAAERAVDAVLGGIKSGLESDGTVSIHGFGTWNVKQRAGRQGRNPSTGETMYIAPSTTVTFRPGSKLKSTI